MTHTVAEILCSSLVPNNSQNRKIFSNVETANIEITWFIKVDVHTWIGEHIAEPDIAKRKEY